MININNEIWAAILGAAIAGLIGYLLQRQNLNEARQQRTHDRLDHQQSLASSFVVKLSFIYSHAVQLDRAMKSFEARLDADPQMRPCQAAQPISPVPSPVNISTGELTLLFTLKLNDQFNAAAMMDERHNNLLHLLTHFNEKKVALNAMVTPQGFTGVTGHIISTEDEMRKLQPYMIELDQLFAALVEQSNLLMTESRNLLGSVVAALNEKLGLAMKLDTLG